jgi:hypothetical protein
MYFIFKRLLIFSPFLNILQKYFSKYLKNPTLKNEQIFKIENVTFNKKKILF